MKRLFLIAPLVEDSREVCTNKIRFLTCIEILPTRH